MGYHKMTASLKFDCPKCSKEHELSLSIEEVQQTSKRTTCSSCGEHFEIAPRVANSTPKARARSSTKVETLDTVNEALAEPKGPKVRFSNGKVESGHQHEGDERIAPKALDWLDQADMSIEEYTLTMKENKNLLRSLFAKWG